MNKELQTVYVPKESVVASTLGFERKSGYFFTPEELEEIKKEIEWGTLYDPCENCGGGHIRPCNHCGDLGFHRKYYTTEELEKFKAEWQREESKERFRMPTDSQIVKTAIIFNDGKINETELSNMVAMADFIINRLYENGDISIPASNENETPITQ